MDHAAAGQGRIAQCPSNPEVADQCRTVLGDQDVAWLHITVDDPDRVGSCQRRRDFCTYSCGFVRLQWSTLFQYGGEGDRGDELHDEPQLAVLLDRIEDRHCVRC
jgi:hypothetical protein